MSYRATHIRDLLADLPPFAQALPDMAFVAAGIALWVQTAHLVRHPHVAARCASGTESSFEAWSEDQRTAFVRRRRLRIIQLVVVGLVWIGAVVLHG